MQDFGPSGGSGGKFIDGTVPTDAVYTEGNVGIGTITPTAKLEIESPMGSDFLKFTSSNTSDVAIVKIDGTDLVFSIDPTNIRGNSSIDFLTDGAERMTINNTGRVGIGISSPTTPLDVVGKIKSTSLQIATAAASVIGKIWTATDTSGNGKWDTGIKTASVYSTNTDTTTNINNNTANGHLDNVPIFGTNTLTNDDSSFTNTSSTRVTCNFTGRVRIIATLHTFSLILRVNPAIRIKKNGTVIGPTGATGYIRADSGHNESSHHIACCEFDVVSTDYIELGAMAEAAAGTVTMRFAGSSAISIERMRT